jgi:hypothetical protein
MANDCSPSNGRPLNPQNAAAQREAVVLPADVTT